MRPGPRLAVVLALVTCSTWLAAGRVPAAAADADTPRVRLRRVARVLDGTAIAARARDTSLYVAEQHGTISELRDGKLRGPVLDLTDVVSQDGGERGLLGLAFSPGGDHLYVHYSDRAGDTQVV